MALGAPAAFGANVGHQSDGGAKRVSATTTLSVTSVTPLGTLTKLPMWV
jgi:hypothetical protein